MSNLESTLLLRKKPKNVCSFLFKCYLILQNPENANIIRWSDDGKNFIILKLQSFCKEILPKNFRHRKYQSFVRQLNMYNFKKIKGQHKNNFANPYFIKDQFQNLSKIRRRSEEKRKEKLSENSQHQFQEFERQPKQILQEERVERKKKVRFALEEKSVNNEGGSTIENCYVLLNSSQKLIQKQKDVFWRELYSNNSISFHCKTPQNVQNHEMDQFSGCLSIKNLCESSKFVAERQLSEGQIEPLSVRNIFLSFD